MRRRSPRPLLLLRSIAVALATAPALLFLALLLLPSRALAYRVGDAVGVLLRIHAPSIGSSTREAYRHQLPRFGVSTTTRFDVASLIDGDDLRLAEDGGAGGGNPPPPRRKEKNAQPEERLRLSLSFDEGFHRVPWFDVCDPSRNKALEAVVATVVYSGGDGSVHAVHHEVRYRQRDGDGGGRGGGGGSGCPTSFAVEYVWVNEADVDARGGFAMLFAAVLIASLGGLVGACASSTDDDAVLGRSPGDVRRRGYKEKRSSSSLGLGASEGIAKRL